MNESTPISRRRLLATGAVGAGGLLAGGIAAQPSFARGRRRSGLTLNWLTWSDHYANDQIKAVSGKIGIGAKPKLFSDNADALLQTKKTGGLFDIVSGDALWVAKYYQDKLIEPINLDDVPASKELYSLARSFSFWHTSSGSMGYPFSWSTVQMYYNPKTVKTAPDSWQALTDKQFKGKIVAENIPTDLMAIAARATGAKKPYSMTPAEIKKAKDFLAALKPNIIKLASQNNEVVTMLASGAASIGITNLGTEYRVKDAGGPVVKAAYPKEGTIGFIDSEMVVSKAKHHGDVLKFLDAMERGSYIAKNFLTNGRPLFNEKAKKLLINQGQGDRVKRLYMDQPQRALKMTLKGPAGDEQAYVEAFNEVFGG